MKHSKKADEKNSLEQLLLRWKSSYEANKSQTYRVVGILVLIILIVVMFQSKIFRGTDKTSFADNAYYAATQAAFAGAGTVEASPLAEAAKVYKNTPVSGILYLEAGEAFLNVGLNDVAAKVAHSRGVKSETELVDPAVNFNSAYEAFSSAANSKDNLIKARAQYGMGIAQESLASIAANNEEVEAALAKARSAYEVVGEIGNSPYRVLALERLSSLTRGVATDFYKDAAQKFINLPDPSETESILSGNDELKAGEPVEVEGFDPTSESDEQTEESISDQAQTDEAAAQGE